MDRFFNKVEKTDSCWNWKGASRGSGYGAIKFRDKVVDTHRVSWILHNGEIPLGLCVCHKCDNRKCVNPEHLFLGTQKDNMQDCKAKGRLITPIGGFPKEHYPKNASCSLEKALFIKKLILSREGKPLKKIAQENNVSYQFVRDISCGRTLKRNIL